MSLRPPLRQSSEKGDPSLPSFTARYLSIPRCLWDHNYAIKTNRHSTVEPRWLHLAVHTAQKTWKTSVLNVLLTLGKWGKTEIPQNNKVFLCDPPLVKEVWLFSSSSSSLHHWFWRPMGTSASHSQPLLSGEARRQIEKHVKWAEITIQWLTYTDAVVAELKYVWWETRRNLLTRLLSYLQGFDSHKLVNHVLSICPSAPRRSLSLLCLLPRGVGGVSRAEQLEPNVRDCPASSGLTSLWGRCLIWFIFS